jgi:hypothetical protein
MPVLPGGRHTVAVYSHRSACRDLKHVFFTLTHNMVPVTADEMRPARVLRKCRFRRNFRYSLKESKHLPATKNTLEIYLIPKPAARTRLGLGAGIHWHVENKVMYYR